MHFEVRVNDMGIEVCMNSFCIQIQLLWKGFYIGAFEFSQSSVFQNIRSDFMRFGQFDQNVFRGRVLTSLGFLGFVDKLHVFKKHHSEPTMSITISVNSSPLAGTEGKKLTSTQIRDRLVSEAQNNVGITFSQNANVDSFVISGRGELMLEILLTQMRREGFEMTVSPPKLLYQKEYAGNKLEPIEEITVDLDEEYSSKIIDTMNR